MAATEEEHEEPTVVYKIKVVHFLGRSVPIILQNDNGPCPLLAICNVLLLRNTLSINPDIGEIPLQTLLAHVAEKLLDSNSDFEHKDDEYIRNQQQNISDAITLLPRLATGIDVNVRFRHIHDFEFTPECAIFDLLDIDLVHGWLCDPQDEVTSRIIGDNSYNVLVEKLVALESSRADFIIEDAGQETSVDFAAATTASLGIPSPSLSLSRMKSLEGLNFTSGSVRRKGDDEETTQLLQALQLSETAKVSYSSKASQTGIGAHRLAADDSLLKKQENNESLSFRWESTGILGDSEHDVDSSNQSIGSGEILSGEAVSTCPCPNPTSSSGLAHSTMEFEHEMSPEDLASVIAETETHDLLTGQNIIDSTDTKLHIQEHALADRIKQTYESSTSSSHQKLEDVSSDMGSYGGEAFLQSIVNPQQHETPLADEIKQRFQSTSTSNLKVNESASCLDSKETDATGLEEDIRLLDADESSRLSLAGGMNQANCLYSADASQYQLAPCPVEADVYDAAQVQALEEDQANLTKEDQANLTKEAAVVGSGNRLELLSKQEFQVTSEGSSIEVVPLPEGSYTKAARDEETAAYAFDSMAETLYEGESMLADAEAVHCANVREPLYEGEGILINSADERIDDAHSPLRLNSDAVSLSRNDTLSVSASEGFIIENFLLNHASQLTYCGLFSLQEGLKERELCVFFRNNHFSTMFKYEGDLYLLATDQGYFNQPDLVWEKLTEVDGDSVFFTGSFSLFKADHQSHGSWNEQDVVNATTDYISSHQKGATDLQDNGQLNNYNTDFQLAMALQQEELDQQQQQRQQQQQHHVQVSSPVPPQRSQPGARPSTGLTAGRLFSGPKSTSSASKAETKSKDKCVVM